jgi:hypothetical protein
MARTKKGEPWPEKSGTVVRDGTSWRPHHRRRRLVQQASASSARCAAMTRPSAALHGRRTVACWPLPLKIRPWPSGTAPRDSTCTRLPRTGTASARRHSTGTARFSRPGAMTASSSCGRLAPGSCFKRWTSQTISQPAIRLRSARARTSSQPAAGIALCSLTSPAGMSAIGSTMRVARRTPTGTSTGSLSSRRARPWPPGPTTSWCRYGMSRTGGFSPHSPVTLLLSRPWPSAPTADCSSAESMTTQSRSGIPVQGSYSGAWRVTPTRSGAFRSSRADGFWRRKAATALCGCGTAIAGPPSA